MIETYVKWFCDWVDVPYQNIYTVDIWKAEADKGINNNFDYVQYNIPERDEQMTIFDCNLNDEIAI